MMREIEDRCHDRQRGIDRERQSHVYDLADMQKGECSDTTRLYDCTQYPSQHGQTGSPKEKMSRIGKVFQEEQCEKAKENINSDFCEQPNKDRRYSDRRCMVGRGQPEEERKQRRFNAKSY